MFKHHPIIIPEINNQHEICDYLIQTATILSKKKYPTYIFYVNLFSEAKPKLKKISDNLFSFSPIKIIPFNRFKFVQQINIYLSFNILILISFFQNFKIPYIWLFYPQIYSLIKPSLPCYKLIYDIVDFFTSPQPNLNHKLNNQKKLLLKKANLITAISQNLKISYQKILPSTKIHIVPQGFNLIKSSSVKTHPEAKKIKKIPNKIGFIGAINNRLDFDLLFKLIKNTPNFNYIFVGPQNNDINVKKKPVEKLSKKLFSFPNVHNIGLVPKNQLSQFIGIFDIAIIPYDVSDKFNRLCYPMKLFEYFAAGKPVISTPIIELKNFPKFVKIGKTAKEWQTYIESILNCPWPQKLQEEEKNLAQQNSWKNKINLILHLIDF